MKKAILLSLLTTLAGAATVSAQPPAAPDQPAHSCEHARTHLFEKLDANKDGSVSRDELLSKATERFDRTDANKDGTLTAEERQAAHQAFADEHFKKADKNGDGALASDELPPRLAGMLAKLDANKDGKLTRAELSAGREKLAQRFAHKHPQAEAKKTRAELVAHVGARFDKLDTNKDGVLSSEELSKGHFGRHRRHFRGSASGV